MRVLSIGYQVHFPGHCASADILILNYGATSVASTKKYQFLL
jgi:hypothetical protein